MAKGLNNGFRIARGELEERIGSHVSFPEEYEYVVPLKEIIKALLPPIILSKEEISSFIKSMPLVASPDIKPFEKAEISFYNTDPRSLYTPQTFVLGTKITNMLNAFDTLYHDFNFPSLANRPAHYIVGLNKEEERVVALYVPPLVEQNKHDLLFDGNHRSTICGGVGAPHSVIGIRGSTVKPPYRGVPWKMNIVDKKPSLEKRYIDFNPALLKDFAYVGIDG